MSGQQPPTDGPPNQPTYGQQPGYAPPSDLGQPPAGQQPGYAQAGGYAPPGYSLPPGYPPPPPGYAPPPGYGQPGTGWYAPPEPIGPAPGVYFAPHGERLLAYIIDALVLFGVIFLGSIAVLAFGLIGGRGLLAAGGLLFVLFIVATSIAYFPLFWARGGQTPGMKPFRLYVVRDSDGGPISGGQAFLRLLGYWVNGIAFYIGFIWIFVDVRRRGWHDLIAGTLVVKR